MAAKLMFVVAILSNTLSNPVQASVYDYSILSSTNFSARDKIIACLYVHQRTDPKSSAYSNIKSNLIGHAYLEITNTYSHVVFLQGFQIDPSESLTVGLWGTLTASSGGVDTDKGVYINREAFYYSHLETPSDCTMIMGYSAESNLNKLHSFVYQKAFVYDLISYNCTSFAMDCWKILTGYDFNSGGNINTPIELAYAMETQNDYAVFNGSVQFSTDVFYSYYKDPTRFRSYKIKE